MLHGTRAAALALVLAVGGCGGAPTTSPVEETAMRLTSAAFADGDAIPSEHTCDGEDLSPPLAWSDAPMGTTAYVLVVEDPDARNFVHWLLTDIPGDTGELPAGRGDRIGRPGPNDFGTTGWGGPCPPSGEHRYVFTLYALSEAVGIGDGGTLDDARSAMEGRVLAETSLTGRYSRQR